MATLAEIEAEIARRKTGGNASRLRMLDAEIERRKQAYLAETPPQAPPEMRLNPETGQMVDLEQMARLDRSKEGGMGYAADLAGQYVRGTPLIGEYADEAAGKVVGAFGGDGDLVRDRARAKLDSFEQDNPKAAMGAQMAGGVVGSLPAVAAFPAAAIPQTMGMKILAGGSIGATGGAVDGFVSGYGAGTDPDSRRQQAQQRAMVQGAFGGGLGAAAPLVSSGIRKASGHAIDAFKARGVRKSAGLSKPAAEALDRSLEQGGDYTAARQGISRGGADMLADATPGARAIADEAIQSSGPAGAKATRIVEGRASAANKILKDEMDNLMGAPRGVKEVAREISEDTLANRQKTYGAAFDTPIDYLSAHGRAVEDALDRVPAKTLKKAVNIANDAMRMEGRKNLQVMAKASDSGDIVFKEMPNVEQIDSVKRALDELGRVVNVHGRPTGDAIRAKAAAKLLRNATKKAVPEYGDALAAGADKITQDEALSFGRKIFNQKTNLEDVIEEVSEMGAPQLKRVKEGIRAEIDKAMALVKRTMLDANMDAREAGKVVSLLGSRDNLNKIEAVLGHADTVKLARALAKADAALSLKASVIQNSKTYARESMRKAREAAVEPGIIENAVKLKLLAFKDSMIGSLTQTNPADKLAKIDALNAELIDALMGPNGRAKLDAIEELRRIAPGNKALANKLSEIGMMATVLPGYSQSRELGR